MTDNTQILVAIALVLFTIAGAQQCHYDHETEIKCIEMTKDKYCRTGK